MKILILFAALLSAAPPSKLAPVDELTYGKTVAARKGKVVLVNFWATWCVPCRKEMPELARMATKLKAKGLELITVSADEPEDEKAALTFLAKAGIAEPAYLKRAKNDDKFIGTIDPKWSGALPALILYDKAGKKVKTWVGETDLKALEAEVKKLL
ncbi:MAG: TlpA family protein disulfide reductase [Acidobacteria bacterium]|nr:TlpA family protein disulfide reductase [Acidobacteriota bacterium]